MFFPILIPPNKPNANSGMICLDRNKVIRSCKEIIAWVDNFRSQERKKFVEKYKTDHEVLYRHFWWLGFPKPTVRRALNQYLHGEHPLRTPELEVYIKHMIQYNLCKTVLVAAEASVDDVIWLSPECIEKSGVA